MVILELHSPFLFDFLMDSFPGRDSSNDDCVFLTSLSFFAGDEIPGRMAGAAGNRDLEFMHD